MNATSLRVAGSLFVIAACAVGAITAFANGTKGPKDLPKSRVVLVGDVRSTAHRTDGDAYFEVDRLDKAIVQLEKEGWILKQVSAIDADSALLWVERAD